MELAAVATFQFDEYDDPHRVDDSACPSCWINYPLRCKCGGLVHAVFGDEDEDGFWLERKCDRCGHDWETVDGLI